MADIPLTISDIEFWFRGSDCTTSTWPDVTGSYTGSVTDVTFTDGIPTFDGDGKVNLGIVPTLTEWTIFGYVKPSIIDQIGSFLATDAGGYNNDILFGIKPETGAGGDPPRRFCLDHQDETNFTRTLVYDSVDATLNWYSVCVTSDGSNLILYVDGTLVDTTPKNGAALTWGNGFNTTGIGYNPAAVSRSWKGLVSDIMVYRRALTSGEITSLHDFVTNPVVPKKSGNMFLMF